MFQFNDRTVAATDIAKVPSLSYIASYADLIRGLGENSELE